MAKPRTKIEGVKKAKPVKAKPAKAEPVAALVLGDELTLVGGNYSQESRDLLRVGIDTFLKAGEDTDEAVTLIAKSISVIDLIRKGAKGDALFGYATTDIKHNARSYSQLHAASMQAILDRSNKGIYEGRDKLLGHLVSQYVATEGAKPLQVIAAFMDTDGNLVAGVDTVSKGFHADWGNGEPGYHGLLDSYRSLDNAARTNLTRLTKSLAYRSEVIDGVKTIKMNGVEVEVPAKVKQVIDTKVREFQKAKKAAEIEATEKAAKELAAKPEANIIHEKVNAIVELMGKVEVPVIGQMNVPSRDKVNGHLKAALVDLLAADHVTTEDIEAEVKALAALVATAKEKEVAK